MLDLDHRQKNYVIPLKIMKINRAHTRPPGKATKLVLKGANETSGWTEGQSEAWTYGHIGRSPLCGLSHEVLDLRSLWAAINITEGSTCSLPEWKPTELISWISL